MSLEADTPVTEILLSELEEGFTERALEVDASALGFEDEYFTLPEVARVKLRIGRSIETYSFKGSITCSVGGECCRCLERIEESLETDLRLLVQRKLASEEELKAVDEEEEVMILDPGAKSVDLKTEIREALVLALPLRILCTPDCKGLCTQCGANLNQNVCNCSDKRDDTRWAALKELKFQ
jgi:uncharacterized protein